MYDNIIGIILIAGIFMGGAVMWIGGNTITNAQINRALESCETLVEVEITGAIYKAKCLNGDEVNIK